MLLHGRWNCIVFLVHHSLERVGEFVAYMSPVTLFVRGLPSLFLTDCLNSPCQHFRSCRIEDITQSVVSNNSSFRQQIHIFLTWKQSDWAAHCMDLLAFVLFLSTSPGYVFLLAHAVWVNTHASKVLQVCVSCGKKSNVEKKKLTSPWRMGSQQGSLLVGTCCLFPGITLNLEHDLGVQLTGSE